MSNAVDDAMAAAANVAAATVKDHLSSSNLGVLR